MTGSVSVVEREQVAVNWSPVDAHAIYADALRCYAREKREVGDLAAARELERMADVEAGKEEAARDVAAELEPGRAWGLVHDIDLDPLELEP